LKEGQSATLIANRRKELLIESSRGNLGEAIKDLAVKYSISEDTLYKDWALRDQWINEIITIDDPTLAKKYFMGLEEVIQEAKWMIKQADNSNAKVGALRIVKETYGLLLDILVKAGYLAKGNDFDQISEIRLTFVDPWRKDKDGKPTYTVSGKDYSEREYNTLTHTNIPIEDKSRLNADNTTVDSASNSNPNPNPNDYTNDSVNDCTTNTNNNDSTSASIHGDDQQ
jgi:hypothetical protein